MNTLISQMIIFFVILGCGFIGAKLGLLKAEVIHGLSSLLMGVICPLMLIAVFRQQWQEENAWDIAKSVIPYALITYPLLTGAGSLQERYYISGEIKEKSLLPNVFRKYGVLWAASCKRDI